jgi:hypothetical protein
MRRIYSVTLFFILLPLSSAYGQGTLQEQNAFIDKSLSRIFNTFNERESQVIQQQEQRKKAEAEALQNLFNIATTSVQAQQAVSDLVNIEKALSQKSVMASAEFTASIRQERAAAEERRSAMASQAEGAKNQVASARTEVKRGENELRALIARDSEKRGALSALQNNWLSHQTGENFSTLLGVIQITSNDSAVTSDVNITSQDKAGNPTTGARVRFEGDDERRKGTTPGFSCVTALKPCTEKNIGIGFYYFWTERERGATSDKKFGKFITDPVNLITIIEDR